MSQNIVTQGKEWKTGHAGIQKQSYLKSFLTFMQYIAISMIKEHALIVTMVLVKINDIMILNMFVCLFVCKLHVQYSGNIILGWISQ